MKRTVRSQQRDALVEAARRVMIEVWQILGSYSDAMVIVGGWVPELMISDPEIPHSGSIDVDLLLDPSKLIDGRYETIVALLCEQGYKAVADKPFQLQRAISIGSRRIRVDVDFLIPARSVAARGKGLMGSFRPISLEGGAIALRNPTTKSVRALMPSGKPNTVSVTVAALGAFVVLKCLALQRNADKDPYDLYFCLRNAPGGPRAIARQLAPFRHDRVVRKAMRLLEEKCQSPDDYFPSIAAAAYAEDNIDLRSFVARDFYERSLLLLKYMRDSER